MFFFWVFLMFPTDLSSLFLSQKKIKMEYIILFFFRAFYLFLLKTKLKPENKNGVAAISASFSRFFYPGWELLWGVNEHRLSSNSFLICNPPKYPEKFTTFIGNPVGFLTFDDYPRQLSSLCFSQPPFVDLVKF